MALPENIKPEAAPELYWALEGAVANWETHWDGEDVSIPGWVIAAQQVMRDAHEN